MVMQGLCYFSLRFFGGLSAIEGICTPNLPFSGVILGKKPRKISNLRTIVTTFIVFFLNFIVYYKANIFGQLFLGYFWREISQQNVKDALLN